ncbi:MAG: hypothetical protein MJZ79_02120 [Paludibacteraceae bacterium]|nr:hypothetical protein [Paludibacteraceae bacterium]
MTNFVAIDLETATSVRSSICQIGITEVINGVPQMPKSWLIRPDGNNYDCMNIAIHGITPEVTENAPSFSQVWKEVLPYLQNKIVVAHNTSFDMYALRDALDKYGIEYPTFDYFCSLRIARYIIKGCYSHSLDVVLDYLHINFGVHHKADADSLGCALLLLECLKREESSIEDLETKYNFHRGIFAPNKFIPQLSTKKPNKSTCRDFIKGIEVDPTKFDEGNYFFNKVVCFTGKCEYGTRNDLLRKVAEIGGIPTDSVTNDTDVLVVGQQDYRRVGEEGMSGKQKKAMNILANGKEIEILSETEFISRL